MNHLLRATALTAVAALALSACGGGDDIKGAHKGGASPSASTTTVPKTVFTFPKDVKVEISADKTGNKKKDAVLAAQAEALMARQKLYAAPDPKSPLIQRYFSPETQEDIASQMRQANKEDRAITGTTRYYHRKVEWVRRGAAELTYCEDQSKSFDKNVKTHKVKYTPTSANSYIKYQERLEKRSSGVWRVDFYSGSRGARGCR